MDKRVIKNLQAKYSWGILLGMSGIPVLALMDKIFPAQQSIWMGLMLACGLIIVRCAVGYLMAGTGPSKKSRETALNARG